VPTVPTPGKAHIPYYADKPTTRNENPVAVLPNLIQLVVESLILYDRPELAFVGGIFL
jgi:hypothetical protein